MFKFKDFQGISVSLEDIVQLLENDYEYQIFVGTDSKIYKKKKCIIYATCIIVYKKGKGGKIFVAKESKNILISLRERLMNEVWRSLEVSFKLSEILPKSVEVIVHVDVNKSKKFKSGDYCQELVSTVTGQGFKCKVKPDSFAAQHVADKYTK